jgi:hypothetical protein
MVRFKKHNWQVFKHSLLFAGKSKLEDTLICSTQMGQDPPNQHIIGQKKLSQNKHSILFCHGISDWEKIGLYHRNAKAEN